jgi:CDI immunity protein
VSDQEILPRAWADIDYNDKGIFIVTRSGYRSAALDDNGLRRFLARDVSNLVLGNALIDCLNASRVIPESEWKAFFDWRDTERRANDYQKWRLAMAGVKTTTAFAKYMMICSARVLGDELIIYSWVRTSPRNWDFPKAEVEPVRIPFASPAAEIGAALREAMNRCTGLGREAAQLPEPMPD